MKHHAAPAPPSLGARAGLSYALFLPDEEPSCGVLILHGAGSAKESHFDFARLCRAHGMAALAFDARGHGRSEGELGPGAFDDALVMLDLLREHAPRVALRGSSMGGWGAIHTAALAGDAVAVVAICPVPEDLLLRSIRSGGLQDARADEEALIPWLESLDLYAAAARLGPKTALLLLHARGDEQVPWTVSEELHEAASDPKRLMILPGGHHRSLQHDGEVQAIAIRYIAKPLGTRD
jgi:pimeloyl-ACP methyl ester carboxylesterase